MFDSVFQWDFEGACIPINSLLFYAGSNSLIYEQSSHSYPHASIARGVPCDHVLEL